MDVQDAVRKEVPALLAERDRIKQERDGALSDARKVSELEREVVRLRRAATPALYTTRLLASERVGNRTLVFVLSAGVAAILLAMILILALTDSLFLSRDTKITLAGMAGLAALTSLISALALARQNRRILVDLDDVTTRALDSEFAELRGSTGPRALSRLQAVFINMADSWPEEIRDEVLYQLHERLANVPISIAGRVAADLVSQLGVRLSGDQLDFAEWMEAVALLRPIDRRLLLDLLRQRRAAP